MSWRLLHNSVYKLRLVAYELELVAEFRFQVVAWIFLVPSRSPTECLRGVAMAKRSSAGFDTNAEAATRAKTKETSATDAEEAQKPQRGLLWAPDQARTLGGFSWHSLNPEVLMHGRWGPQLFSHAAARPARTCPFSCCTVAVCVVWLGCVWRHSNRRRGVVAAILLV
jgi:hypothetical protein